MSCRDNFLPVHDKDLQRWAILRANELDFNFNASATFIYDFKRKHLIGSRKIMKLVSNKYILEKQKLERNANEFRANILNKIENYNKDLILNSDQTGFNYESASKRTLSYKAEKITVLKVQSKNAVTHSFTAMPTISMSGKIFGIFEYLFSRN